MRQSKPWILGGLIALQIAGVGLLTTNEAGQRWLAEVFANQGDDGPAIPDGAALDSLVQSIQESQRRKWSQQHAAIVTAYMAVDRLHDAKVVALQSDFGAEYVEEFQQLAQTHRAFAGEPVTANAYASLGQLLFSAYQYETRLVELGREIHAMQAALLSSEGISPRLALAQAQHVACADFFSAA